MRKFTGTLGWSRRDIVKSLLAAAAAAGAAGSRTAFAAEPPRVLTIYVTWSGGSELVAREIHRLVGGDIARIEPVTPYPVEYREMTKVAEREKDEAAKPAIKPAPRLEDYDVIAVCHPIWSGRMPRVLHTILEGRDLGGKTILHAVTHGGSRLGGTQEELEGLLPGARVLPGLAIYGWGGVKSVADVGPWLKEIGAPGQ